MSAGSSAGRGEELAGRLSDAQRSLLASLPRSGKGNPPEGHWVLWDARLAHCQITGNDEASRWTITPTELGLAALRARQQPQPVKD